MDAADTTSLAQELYTAQAEILGVLPYPRWDSPSCARVRLELHVPSQDEGQLDLTSEFKLS